MRSIFGQRVLCLALIGAATLLSAPLAHAKTLTFDEQNRIDFKVRVPHRGRVSYAVRFESDRKLIRSGYGDLLRNLPKSEVRTQLLVMKSALVVNRRATDFQSPMILSDRVIQSLFQLFDVTPAPESGRYRFSRDLTDMAPAFALRMMGFPTALKTECEFALSVNRAEIDRVAGELDSNLPQPTSAILQSCGRFNLMFTSSVTLSRYHPLNDGSTLVVTIQVARVKQSSIDKADPIPFFSLERTLKDQFKVEVESFWNALHRVEL